jgi:hypothetical protein
VKHHSRQTETTPTANSPLQAAALRYAANGLPVFLLSRTKRPVALCQDCANADASHDRQACPCLMCHGFYAATTDPRRIARMFAYEPFGLLALRTGSASGLVVIDIDPDAGGTPSLSQFVAQGVTPPTRFVRTGSGGLHLYYRYPTGQRVPSSQSRIGAGIDVRGDGGYVVLPPSLHPRTRRPYEWADQSTPVHVMAPALVTACQPARYAPIAAAQPLTSNSAGAITAPDRLLASLLATVQRAPAGTRRTTLYGAAHGVARLVKAGAMTSQDGYNALISTCQQAGWDIHRGTERAIRDGFAAEGVTA